jgi:hypothetical protein
MKKRDYNLLSYISVNCPFGILEIRDIGFKNVGFQDSGNWTGK